MQTRDEVRHQLTHIDINRLELDYILYGDPSWDEVRKFFLDGEFYEEHYLVQAIERHLLTDEQRTLMFMNHLTTEKMLNGRVEGQAGLDAENQIYAGWNEKLGWIHFGYA